VGPAVLLVLVLLVAPLLRKAPFGWKGALASAVGVVIVVALGFVVTARSGPDAVKRDLPGRTFASGAPGSAASDWPAYGGTQGAQHYSALAQITPENVARLERAWVAHTGDLPDDMEDNSYGAETTPLKVGDTLYLCSAMNVLIALDPATGQERWRYDPEVSPDWIPYTAACRGVAYHAADGADPAEPCATRIVEGTLDARIVAV